MTASKTKIIILHGWAMHAGLFDSLVKFLSADYTVEAIDLPGHGFNRETLSADSIAEFAQQLCVDIIKLQDRQHENTILVGWSLGSLIAQQIALLNPNLISKMILIAGTPCFTQSDTWLNGMKQSALIRFADDLIKDYKKTLERFLSLQFMGSDSQKKLLRETKELLFSRPDPNDDMLKQGLRFLKETDLRDDLKNITCPVLTINGERDSLIPSVTASYLARKIPNGQSVVLKGAGHAPFLSHTEIFNQHLRTFLYE